MKPHAKGMAGAYKQQQQQHPWGHPLYRTAAPHHITHLKSRSRNKGCSRALQRTAAATKAPHLASRSCAVLWDLDNLHPGSANVLSAINEVRDLLDCMGLQQPPSVNCYANTTTTNKLGAACRQQLSEAGVVLQQVQSKQQAADVRLSSDAYALARAWKDDGCLVIATDDTDFAPILAYCTSLGVVTVLVTSLRSPKYMPGLLPDPRGDSLAAACTAAVPWQRPSSSSNNRAMQPAGAQQQQQGLRTPLSSSAGLWRRLTDMQSNVYIEPWLFIMPSQSKPKKPS